jgi:hypothetical protein
MIGHAPKTQWQSIGSGGRNAPAARWRRTREVNATAFGGEAWGELMERYLSIPESGVGHNLMSRRPKCGKRKRTVLVDAIGGKLSDWLRDRALTNPLSETWS